MTQQTTAHKTVMALQEHTRKDLELKFRNVHALIKLEAQVSLYRSPDINKSS
jgi:hypothetical protein